MASVAALSAIRPGRQRTLPQTGKYIVCWGEVWCPYADPASTLEKFEEEKKEKNRVNWRHANEKKLLQGQTGT